MFQPFLKYISLGFFLLHVIIQRCLLPAGFHLTRGNINLILLILFNFITDYLILCYRLFNFLLQII